MCAMQLCLRNWSAQKTSLHGKSCCLVDPGYVSFKQSDLLLLCSNLELLLVTEWLSLPTHYLMFLLCLPYMLLSFLSLFCLSYRLAWPPCSMGWNCTTPATTPWVCTSDTSARQVTAICLGCWKKECWRLLGRGHWIRHLWYPWTNNHYFMLGHLCEDCQFWKVWANHFSGPHITIHNGTICQTITP